jgi:hypothetical protein
VSDFLKPPATLLCKLASIAVHAEEYLSPDGHQFDRDALQSALSDPEVTDWIAAMSAAALAPRKRQP